MLFASWSERGTWRYRTRLVVGLLAVWVPVTVLVVVVLTRAAAQTVEQAVQRLLAERATEVAWRLEDLVAGREADLEGVAEAAAPVLGDPRQLDLLLAAVSHRDYDVVFVAGRDGTVLATTDPARSFDPSREEWFRAAAQGGTTVSPLHREGDELRWLVAAPASGPAGEAVVVGDLSLGALSGVTGDAGAQRSDAVTLVDAEARLVYSSALGDQSDDAALLEAGALDGSRPVLPAVTGPALAGETGARRWADEHGSAIFGGYTPVERLGWGVVAQERADEVRRLAERSKASAADIARIVDGTRDQTAAALDAMETGVEQMRRGLALLEQVTEAAAEVRLTTAQQRSAAERVVAHMEQATGASRQVSTTAEQIAVSAGNLATLASDLRRSATATRARF